MPHFFTAVPWRPPGRGGRSPLGAVLAILAIVLLSWIGTLQPAAAQGHVDRYVRYYLKVEEPVPVMVNAAGDQQWFSGEALSTGKTLFEENCLTCHVGGTTLSNPPASLSLADLHNATPPRDTLDGLVAYLREPMVYDGSEPTDWCRAVPESWMSREQLETLAAFVLRAAETAPGWGVERFGT